MSEILHVANREEKLCLAAGRGQEEHVLLVPVGPKAALLHSRSQFEGTSARYIENVCMVPSEEKDPASKLSIHSVKSEGKLNTNV